MRHVPLCAGVLIGLLLLVPRLNAQVSTSRPYGERQVVNLQGNFGMIGNTNIECTSNCPSPATTNNPSAVMGYVDIDSDATTINSSSSTLNLPAGATIEWAFLYWGGVYESTFGGITNPPASMALDEMLLKPPGSTTYQTITAQGHDTETSAFTGWNTFLAYADVTSIVQSGGTGVYTGADIKLATGSAFTGTGGGWSMIVVYSHPSEENRSISVWDGFQFFGFGANDNFTVTDLLTPSSGFGPRTLCPT